MPTSARKSSLGNVRRGPQKAHIPYRGDNPEVGKKTGIAVQHVERKSDGFEPFGDVLQTADGLLPQRKAKRKSLARQDEYDDEDGEQSMQIDSPVQHLVNLRPPVSPPTIRRRSSIRPVARTSDMDFDQIPSPRPMNAFNRAVRNGGPGPSTLSQSQSRRKAQLSDPPNEGGGDYDYAGTGDEDRTVFDGHSPEGNFSPGDRRTSFSQIDQDDEEEEEEEEDREPTPKPTRQQRGKKKAVEMQDQDEEVENEIAQGMEDIELEPESDASDASQERQPVKKPKTSVAAGKKPSGSRSKKENRPYREGTRRSQRKPLKPLAYWRGERYVYGRPEEYSGPVLVPPIREVIRIPEEPVLPLGKRKRTTSRPRSTSRGVELNEDLNPPALPVENPEEGWDDETDPKCVVLQYRTMKEVERRIAWTSKMVQPKVAATNNWSFDKVFHDDEFIAAGQLIIPPKGLKPSKMAKDNTYVFYVIEGAVNFKIHETSKILATGGMFMVPRGNAYFIENICNRNARLFFTQARKVDMDAEDRKGKEMQLAEARRRGSGRSSSVGNTPSRKVHTPNGRATSLAK